MIIVNCPKCDAPHRFKEDKLGKFALCKACGSSFQIQPDLPKPEPNPLDGIKLPDVSPYPPACPPVAKEPKRPRDVAPRYSTLRSISTALKVLGYFGLICVAFYCFGLFVMETPAGMRTEVAMGGKILIASIVALMGGVFATVCFACSELIKLAIDVEHNTRTTAQA